MKKVLLFASAIGFALSVSAQQTDIPSTYWKDFAENYELYDSWWEVDDQTQNVQALTGLTPKNGLQATETSGNNSYSFETNDDVFHINYVKKKGYEKFELSWMNWAYPADCSEDNWQLVNPINGEPWGAGKDCHRTAKGYSIDFSDPANRIVSFKYQAQSEVSINLRVDICDIKGRKTTKEGLIRPDALEKTSNIKLNDENAWQEFVIIYSDENDPKAYEELEEYFDNTYFYGTCSGVLADGNNSWFNGIAFPTEPGFNIYLDDKRITGLEIYINDESDTKGQVCDIYIKDLTVGNLITRDNATEFTAIPTVDANSTVEITNGVVYSAGAITVFDVLGHKVKSGKEELSIKDLPAGFYFIQTAEGTTKFVK